VTGNGEKGVAQKEVSLPLHAIMAGTEMRYNKLFAKMAIILALAAVAIPAILATPAMADGRYINIHPDHGPVGTEVSVYGSSFTPSADNTTFAKIYFQYPHTALVKTTDIDSLGNFFVVSQCPAGVRMVWVYDESASPPIWVIATFRVEPQIELSKSFGYAGDNITASGTGFAATSNITIYFDSSEVATAITAQNGSFTKAAIIIPESDNGSHNIRAVDGSNNQGIREFITSQPGTISPASEPGGGGVTTSPTSAVVPSGKINRIIGYVGSDVIFSGTGFTPDRIAITYYDNIQVAEAIVDAHGNLSANFKIPASPGGEHTVSVTDGTNTTECIFTMESTAPPAPVPLLPANASQVKPETRFVWEGVTDPSGVTYTLQIASDASFTSGNSTSLVLERSKLTATEYTLTPEETLAPTKKGAPYYWRVRAIDNAANTGDWSTVQELYSGIPESSLPSWTLYSLLAEGGIFICFLGYWLVMRIVRP